MSHLSLKADRLPASAAIFLVLLTLLGATACEKRPPEERLSDTAENVESATDALRALETEIRQQEESLESLRKERRKLMPKLKTLEDRLAARSTDVALFRAVQSALLEDPTLRETAIRVRVEDGHVVLHGVVASNTGRDHAVAIASAAAGVKTVTSRLEAERNTDGRP